MYTHDGLRKYDISPKRYKELCGFCEQYPEWKEALKRMGVGIKAQAMDGMPHGTGTSDPTALIALRRSEIEERINLIERVAAEADKEFAKQIILNVCYEMPYYQLNMSHGLHISRNSFYNRRRKFFYLLSKKRL